MAEQSRLDKVIALARHRGFVFQAGEIYGGSRSAWDYGPLGTELKENIRRQWWQTFVRGRGDMVGLDSSIILPKRVWEASGHVATFTDPLVECLQCHKRFRADNLIEDFEARKGRAAENGLADVPCPNCGTKGQYTEPKAFSGLVKTYLGVVDDESGLHFLRPETAQGIFVNFSNVLTASRKKPPFGIGQVGKAFRNEITPGNFIFRTREFEQMEIEFFTPPAEADEWFAHWVEACWDWFIDLGIDPANIRRFDVPEEDRAHYSAGTIDVEYKFGFPGKEWGELMGIANRTDYDLGEPHRGVRPEPDVLRPGLGREVHPVRHRAVVRPHARDDGVPRRRVPRGGGAQRQGRHRHPHRAQARPAPRAGQGRRAAAVAQREALAARARGRRRAARRSGTSTSTTPAPSAVATAGRTRSARRSASRSTSTRSTTAPSRCATATRWARSACRSRVCAPTSRSASRAPDACSVGPRAAVAGALGVDVPR